MPLLSAHPALWKVTQRAVNERELAELFHLVDILFIINRLEQPSDHFCGLGQFGIIRCYNMNVKGSNIFGARPPTLARTLASDTDLALRFLLHTPVGVATRTND